MNTKDTYGRQIDASYEAVQEYLMNLSSLESVPDIISHGLNVLKRFPDTIAASLFLLNRNTFEFEHRASLPFSERDKAVELFECLVDYGTVGMALETGKITQYPNKKKGNCQGHCMVIPLLASGGPFGIILQTFGKLPEDLEFYKVKMTTFFANLFANKLENAYLASQLKKEHSLLEQRIAARSINLNQNNRELQAILQSVQTGIIVIDMTTKKIVNANPMAYKILGVSNVDFIGKDVSSFFDFFETKEILDPGVKFSRNFESTIKKPNGDKVPVLRTFSNVMLGNKNFRIESFYEISEQKKTAYELKKSNELLELKVQERTEDLNLLVHKLKEEIDERKKAEEKLAGMLEKEKELSNMKTEFVSMISHEFRTPMTLINSAAQMLKKFRSQLSEEDIEHYLNRIVKSVDRMTGMIENVIFIGKSESHNLSLRPKPLNLEKIMKEIAQESIILYGKERNIDISCQTGGKNILLDEDLLRQIFMNLLTNALKYSPDDSIVEFKFSYHEDHCIFIVKDYGIGIPGSEQFKVFELFHRGGNVGNASGTGLGLAVVQKALDLHGGSLELSSKTNYGTTFKITIPCLTEEKT